VTRTSPAVLLGFVFRMTARFAQLTPTAMLASSAVRLASVFQFLRHPAAPTPTVVTDLFADLPIPVFRGTPFATVMRTAMAVSSAAALASVSQKAAPCARPT
jgi:hypothetical protein